MILDQNLIGVYMYSTNILIGIFPNFLPGAGQALRKTGGYLGESQYSMHNFSKKGIIRLNRVPV